MQLATLSDLFIHEIQELYSAEQQILTALPDLIEATTNASLSSALQEHLEKTKTHVTRLQNIADELNFSLASTECKGIEGVIKEGSEILNLENLAVRDAGIIAAAQKVEHYEMASYGSVLAHATELGHTEAIDLLADTLEEEKVADLTLTELAEGGINEDPD